VTTVAVGVIGLGNMGAAVAGRLHTRFAVVGFDLDPVRRESAAAAGIVLADSVTAVAEAADVVVLSLPSPAVSHAVVGEWLAARHEPGLVIETSTVTPKDAETLGCACGEHGSRFVDAAILSGVGLVATGDGALLVGGAPEAVAAAAPFLDSIAARQRHLGRVGSGMAAKVINNAVAHAVYVVLAEAVALGEATGVALASLVDILRDPDGGLVRPLTHRIAERLADRSFEGGMPTDAALKDSWLALSVAHETRVPLFAIQGAHTVYELAVDEGLGRLDYAAIATLWEQWCG
jgi:3-hydroxyisobutyrate dehydrogenase-like beta-hydroxyacid dehydrogenase